MAVSKRDYDIASVLLSLLAIVFLFTTFGGYFYRPKVVYEFGIIVDISSYDVEFNLYRWKNKDRIGGTALVEKMYTFSCAVRFHEKNFDVDGNSDKLFACVRDVTSQIQNFEIYNSTLFVYGTELTRLLCVSDPGKCNQIFFSVTDVVQSFDIRVSTINVRALTGHEEATFGWIGVNDFLGRLRNPSQSKPLGGLDVKNYSVLISFEGKSQKSSHYTLYGNSFDLQSIDLMCYGVRQAYNRALLKLAQTSGWTNTIKHPCHYYPPGDSYTIADLYGPCVPKTSVSKTSIRISPDWNSEKCNNLIRESLSEFEKTQREDIIELKKDLNLSNLNFFGFSRIAELAELIKFEGKTLTELYDHTIRSCDASLNIKHPEICFDILYIYHLVVDRLEISPHDVLVGKKEKIETVTGAMIFNSNSLHPRKCCCLLSTTGLMFMVFTASVFTIMGILTIVNKRRLESKEQN